MSLSSAEIELVSNNQTDIKSGASYVLFFDKDSKIKSDSVIKYNDTDYRVKAFNKIKGIEGEHIRVTI